MKLRSTEVYQFRAAFAGRKCVMRHLFRLDLTLRRRHGDALISLRVAVGEQPGPRVKMLRAARAKKRLLFVYNLFDSHQFDIGIFFRNKVDKLNNT